MLEMRREGKSYAPFGEYILGHRLTEVEVFQGWQTCDTYHPCQHGKCPLLKLHESTPAALMNGGILV
jgi:hypothetical protein